jgi:hypothetical protein
MKYCPNTNCPFQRDFGMASEFRDEVETCPDCGSRLISGEPSQPPQRESRQCQELVIIERYMYIHQAQLAKITLEAHGISSFIRDEHAAGIQSLYGLAFGGIKLEVAKEDAHKALEILDGDNP